MWVTLALAVGSISLLVSGLTWAVRREEIREVARLGRLALRRLDEVAPGELSAVRGKVAGPATVVDPVVEAEVVHFEARLLRRDRGRVLWSQRAGDELELDDGSSRRAVVELVGAELVVPEREVERAEGEPSPTMARLLASIEAPAPAPEAGARYSLERRALSVGDELTVVGVPRLEGAGVRFGAADPLFVTEETLEALQARRRGELRAMDRMLRIGAAVGVCVIAVGLVLLLRS